MIMTRTYEDSVIRWRMHSRALYKETVATSMLISSLLAFCQIQAQVRSIK